MDRKKSERLQVLIIVVLGVVIAGILFYMIPNRYNLNTVKFFEVDSTVVDNPLMGFAPIANNKAYCENANMVFFNITWAEWEPERGKYDIAGLEEKYNIPLWKEENKHGIIRFVCDIPQENEHMDIPEWLYDMTSDGTFYSNEYGSGYSPNYDNTVFQKLHKQALMALAEYCSEDGFVAFVEMGSLGHWGEWHAKDDENNLMPTVDTCLLYANQYSQCFANQLLLTRRNYDFSVDNGMGLYNDMVGHLEETKEWFGWLKSDNLQETMGDPLQLKPVTRLGMKSPVGGEFTSSIPMEDILGDQFGEVLSQISDLHMTFIGPMVPDLTDSESLVAIQSILRRIGYRIYVSKLVTRYDFSENIINVELTWKNEGSGGFFFSWPVTMNIYDSDKNLIYWEALDLNLPDLNDGKEKTVTASIPYTDEISQEFYLGITIRDSESEEYVNMAIEMEEDLGWIDKSRILYHYKK